MRRPWMRTSSAWHAVMFACAMSCVSVLAEAVDAADVIGVALREHDVARRRGGDRVVVALVRLRLEPHAGVHDDATVVGRDQVAARHSGRAPDARAHVDRGGRRRGPDREEVGLVADVLGGHVISTGSPWRAVPPARDQRVHADARARSEAGDVEAVVPGDGLQHAVVARKVGLGERRHDAARRGEEHRRRDLGAERDRVARPSRSRRNRSASSTSTTTFGRKRGGEKLRARAQARAGAPASRW